MQIKRTRRRASPSCLICCLVLTISLGSSLFAHDLWLVPQSFTLTKAGLLRVEVRTGMEFPLSTNAIKPDRPEEFKLLWNGGEKTIGGLREEDDALVGEVEAPGGAAAIAALVLHPRFIELEAKDFNEYLEHEGLGSILELRTQRGDAGQPGRESSQNCAKALLVGEKDGSDLFTKPLGHALEIVPLKNPLRLKKGAPLPLQVLYQGEPLADAQVSIYQANVKEPLSTRRTDVKGTVQLALKGKGPWAIRLVHMIPVEEEDVDWKSSFATLTFSSSP